MRFFKEKESDKKGLIKMNFQTKKRKMTNFGLEEEIRKIKYSICHERVTRKKSESVPLIESMTQFP